MRTLVLMFAFGFGSVLLLPRPARSLDDCVKCSCTEAQAWQNLGNSKVLGIRKIDPMDPNKTVSVPHSPASGFGIEYYCSVDVKGTRTVNYGACKLVLYNQTPVLDCKAAGNNSNHIVRVHSFPKEADWNDWTHQSDKDYWEICPPESGGGGS